MSNVPVIATCKLDLCRVDQRVFVNMKAFIDGFPFKATLPVRYNPLDKQPQVEDAVVRALRNHAPFVDKVTFVYQKTVSLK